MMWLVQLIGASIDGCHAGTVPETDAVVTTGQEEHCWGTKEDLHVLPCCSGRVLKSMWRVDMRKQSHVAALGARVGGWLLPEP